MKRILFGLATSGVVMAGPYAPPEGQPGSDAVAADAPAFVQWAAGGTVSRGKTDISSASAPAASFGTILDALGKADAEGNASFPVVSLGDGGSATLTFTKPLLDVPGPDFAVFENGFGDTFLELGHVEVSSNGVDFFRFPSISLTKTDQQKGTFGELDATDLHNLAGKYRGGFGTPFDLAEMKIRYPLLDIQRVSHVRVLDVVGSLDAAFGTRDSVGNLINDPFKTDFSTGGFDLDAIGAFSQLPSNFEEWLVAQKRDDGSPQADFAGTGVPQLIEYFTGGSNLIVEPGSLRISFDWLSYRTDRDFWLEGSLDLIHWDVLAKSTGGGQFSAISAGAEVLLSGEGKKRVIVVPALGSPYRFFRLGAE